MTEYDLGCLFFHKVCSLGCLLSSIGRDLLVKVGRRRQISVGTSASVAHTARCLPMTVTVQGLSTLTLVRLFGLILSFWTLRQYLLFLVELSCGSAVFHLLCLLFPRSILPSHGVPTMSLCLNPVSAFSTAWLADHFLPVLVSIPA